MKPTLYSAVFRRICEAEHIKLSADDGKIYASLPLLNLFLSRELTVSLNDGGLWQGVLKRVDADGIQIGDDWRGIEKWSVWFDDCRLGMLTGAELDSHNGRGFLRRGRLVGAMRCAERAGIGEVEGIPLPG